MHVASPSNQTKVLSYTHGSAVTGAPKFMLLGAKCVLALNNSDASATNAYVVEALVKGVAKATGAAWTINQPIYFDESESNFTPTSTDNTLCGYAAAAAASGDTTGDLNLISLNP